MREFFNSNWKYILIMSLVSLFLVLLCVVMIIMDPCCSVPFALVFFLLIFSMNYKIFGGIKKDGKK